MSMIGNRVLCVNDKVGSIIIRSYIGKSTGVADEMLSCERVSNVEVLSLAIVDRILCNVDATGIICHTRYEHVITELCECVKLPDCLTRCGG